MAISGQMIQNKIDGFMQIILIYEIGSWNDNTSIRVFVINVYG